MILWHLLARLLSKISKCFRARVVPVENDSSNFVRTVRSHQATPVAMIASLLTRQLATIVLRCPSSPNFFHDVRCFHYYNLHENQQVKALGNLITFCSGNNSEKCFRDVLRNVTSSRDRSTILIDVRTSLPSSSTSVFFFFCSPSVQTIFFQQKTDSKNYQRSTRAGMIKFHFYRLNFRRKEVILV